MRLVVQSFEKYNTVCATPVHTPVHSAHIHKDTTSTIVHAGRRLTGGVLAPNR
jgi:hypothetical protein